jgi:hypothetical protein
VTEATAVTGSAGRAQEVYPGPGAGRIGEALRSVCLLAAGVGRNANTLGAGGAFGAGNAETLPRTILRGVGAARRRVGVSGARRGDDVARHGGRAGRGVTGQQQQRAQDQDESGHRSPSRKVSIRPGPEVAPRRRVNCTTVSVPEPHTRVDLRCKSAQKPSARLLLGTPAMHSTRPKSHSVTMVLRERFFLWMWTHGWISRPL